MRNRVNRMRIEQGLTKLNYNIVMDHPWPFKIRETFVIRVFPARRTRLIEGSGRSLRLKSHLEKDFAAAV